MPTDDNGFEVFGPNEMPKSRPSAPRRGARRKYPWWEVAKGGGFRFGSEVIEQSARVQASTMSKQTGYEFKVYVAEDGVIWCMRVDGVPRSQWPDMHDGKPLPKVRFAPVEPEAAGTLPPATAEIDNEFENQSHDDTGGVPQTWGKDVI